MGNQYSIYAVRVTYAGPTNLDLTQVLDYDVQTGRVITTITPGGSLDPGAHVISSATPVIPVGTRDLAKLLSAVSLTAGLACTGGGAFRYQRRADMGAFAGGSTNFLITAAKGWLGIDQISDSADSDEGARADLIFLPVFDGTNAILAESAGQALAAPAPAFNSVYYMGPVYVDGSQVEGLKSVSVRPGFTFRRSRSDGAVAVNRGYIAARNPQIELVFDHLDMISASVGDIFGAALGGQLDVYFLRGVHGGARMALDAGTNHVRISAAAGLWGPDNVGVRGNEDGTTSVLVQPTGQLSMSASVNVPDVP